MIFRISFATAALVAAMAVSQPTWAADQSSSGSGDHMSGGQMSTPNDNMSSGSMASGAMSSDHMADGTTSHDAKKGKHHKKKHDEGMGTSDSMNSNGGQMTH